MRLLPRLPLGRLERVRYGLTRMGVVLCLLVNLQAIHSPVDTVHVLLSVAASLANAGIICLAAHRRGAVPVVLVPISAGLAVVTGIGIIDPISSVGICSGLVVGQTMYGSRRSVVLRLALLLPVVPLSVAFSTSPLSQHVLWHAQATLAAIPTVPVLGILIFVLRGGLESQAATIARETFSATLSARLLAADTVPDVVDAMVLANDELTRLSPGLLTLELIRIGPGEAGPAGGARLANWHGEVAGGIPELIPPEALAELPGLGEEGFLPLAKGSPFLTGLGLPDRRWHAAALERLPGAPVDLVLYGVRASLGQKLFGLLTPEEVEFIDVLTVMRRHWRKAMARVEARAALIASVEQDDVTGLPGRSATMRRIVELVHGNPDRVGLIILQLAGLERVEETGGVAATDAVMVELTRRMTGLARDDWHVGRGGDQAFAVVLPRADPPEEEAVMVEQLEAALLAPVSLPTGAVRLTLRIGVAHTAEGETAADLLQRASRAVFLDGPGGRPGTRVPGSRRSGTFIRHSELLS